MEHLTVSLFLSLTIARGGQRVTIHDRELATLKRQLRRGPVTIGGILVESADERDAVIAGIEARQREKQRERRRDRRALGY